MCTRRTSLTSLRIDLEVESSRELVTASEVNRRAADREDGVKEAGSEAAGRRTETGYEAVPSRASELAFAKLL